ncbi:MAG: Gfo/Idh/MocA family oxidoreductase [Candidatus Hydrogenedentes bacterium]|nr:Gfo/Idh/MocA family oxidoreductase [Candidatus Hydrogenedentota bacterium]
MNVTRRDFLKTAGVAAGVTIAAGYSPFSYAQNEKVRLAIIGTGGQGSLHLREGLAPNHQIIELVATCDCYNLHRAGGIEEYNKAWKAANKDQDYPGEIKQYMNYREMLEKEQLDAVIIATPLDRHFQMTMDCLDAGKYVFCEKTLCYDIEQCRQVVQKCHDTGLFVQVGHQRRYNPLYNKALWLALDPAMRDKGLVGRINHIAVQWNRNSDWRRPVDPTIVLSEEEKQYIKTDLEHHLNWRLYNEFSAGGLMTELAAHQLDVTNWFLHSMPKRVMGTGGIDYWRDGREAYDNVSLVYEYEMLPDNPAFYQIDKRNDRQDMAKINRPYTVRVTYSSICQNAQGMYSELLQGDRGALLMLSETSAYIYAEEAAKARWDSGGVRTAQSVAAAVTSGKSLTTSKFEERIEIKVANNKTYYRLQFESFANDIKTKGTPKANQMVGLMAAVAALKGNEAMKTGGMIEIPSSLYTFDFETPDPYRYEYWPRWEPWEENA